MPINHTVVYTTMKQNASQWAVQHSRLIILLALLLLLLTVGAVGEVAATDQCGHNFFADVFNPNCDPDGGIIL